MDVENILPTFYAVCGPERGGWSNLIYKKKLNTSTFWLYSYLDFLWEAMLELSLCME